LSDFRKINKQHYRYLDYSIHLLMEKVLNFMYPREKLKDLVTFQTGKLNSNAADENGKFPFFTCSQKIFKTKNYKFDCEAVILGGNNANGVYPLKYFWGKFNAYQRTYIIRSINDNFLKNRYLFYALYHELSVLQKHSTGVTTKYLTLSILENTLINFPPYLAQEKIASILSAYDELIENNNRRIEILEEMAETIYKEWFVHFRYPGHEKVEMIDSELGKIPEGWEVIDIYNLIEEKNIRNDKDEKLPVLSVTNKRKFEYSSKYFSKRVYSKSLKKYKIVQKSEIAFNPARINIGSIAFLDDIDKAIISPMYTVFKAKKEKIEPLYLWKIINQENVFNYIKKLCFGTVRQIFKIEDFSLVHIALPSLIIQKKYIGKKLVYRKLIKKLKRKNETLESIKNLLLLKLISGTIDVSDLDIKIEEKK